RPAATAGLSGRSRRPPPLRGSHGFWAVLEAPMVFTFQPPFFAGLSGYVAEISAAFICAALGIVPTVRHADYVGSWLEVLREDNRAIFRAASQASKAADYILAFGERDEAAADAIDPERGPPAARSTELRAAA
ncbi:zincin-like metallopeptidase domain-containing protein, partial [Sphingomonas sp.]|uniref:zincin-like metallopeptidase domain-containing protein n=1 Tax=Sphingomonas sp. TaxID=28214 RepID=UPI00257BF1F8